MTGGGSKPLKAITLALQCSWKNSHKLVPGAERRERKKNTKGEKKKRLPESHHFPPAGRGVGGAGGGSLTASANLAGQLDWPCWQRETKAAGWVWEGQRAGFHAPLVLSLKMKHPPLCMYMCVFPSMCVLMCLCKVLTCFQAHFRSLRCIQSNRVVSLLSQAVPLYVFRDPREAPLPHKTAYGLFGVPLKGGWALGCENTCLGSAC